MSEPLAVVAARNAMEEARQRLDFAQRDYEYAKQRYLDEVSRPSDGQLLTEGRVR